MTMSARLTTPTGRPARSITGAALNPLSVRKATASSTGASAGIETGLGVIRSAAVSAWRTSCDAEAGYVVLVMALPPLVGAAGTFPAVKPHKNQRKGNAISNSLRTRAVAEGMG